MSADTENPERDKLVDTIIAADPTLRDVPRVWIEAVVDAVTRYLARWTIQKALCRVLRQEGHGTLADALDAVTAAEMRDVPSLPPRP